MILQILLILYQNLIVWLWPLRRRSRIAHPHLRTCRQEMVLYLSQLKLTMLLRSFTLFFTLRNVQPLLTLVVTWCFLTRVLYTLLCDLDDLSGQDRQLSIRWGLVQHFRSPCVKIEWKTLIAVLQFTFLSDLGWFCRPPNDL